MEFFWRITKYNPNFRNENGNYTKDEWSSIYDVGNKYPDGILLVEEYLNVEEKYVNAIISLMNSAEIPHLEVKRLNMWKQEFKYTEYYTESMLKLYSTVKNGDLFQKDELKDLCKLILRENLGCQLWYDSNMYVHFGYDYYMYVGINKVSPETLESIKNSGLFVEECESPYLNIDDSDNE